MTAEEIEDGLRVVEIMLKRGASEEAADDGRREILAQRRFLEFDGDADA
jgi:hypothetical protein